MRNLSCPNCGAAKLIPPTEAPVWTCGACYEEIDETVLRAHNANTPFSKLLDDLLKPSGTSRAQLCRDMFICPSFLSKCEMGEKNPSNFLFRQLAQWARTRHGGKLGKRLEAKLSNPVLFLHKKSRLKRRDK